MLEAYTCNFFVYESPRGKLLPSWQAQSVVDYLNENAKDCILQKHEDWQTLETMLTDTRVPFLHLALFREDLEAAVDALESHLIEGEDNDRKVAECRWCIFPVLWPVDITLVEEDEEERPWLLTADAPFGDDRQWVFSPKPMPWLVDAGARDLGRIDDLE